MIFFSPFVLKKEPGSRGKKKTFAELYMFFKKSGKNKRYLVDSQFKIILW